MGLLDPKDLTKIKLNGFLGMVRFMLCFSCTTGQTFHAWFAFGIHYLHLQKKVPLLKDEKTQKKKVKH